MEEKHIDRSQVNKATTIGIVLMCLAAVLPILMTIVVYVLLRYRSLQMKRKKFADDWNITRINSFRNKIIAHNHSISLVSSRYLDANYFQEKGVNIELKRVSSSLITDETSVSSSANQRTLQHFNDVYVEDSSTEEGAESLKTRSGSKSRGAFQKKLLIHRASSRSSISCQTTNVKSALVQMLNVNPRDKSSLERNKIKHDFRTSGPQESDAICDQTLTKTISGKEGDSTVPSLNHLSQNINSANNYNRMVDLQQVTEIGSSATTLNPQFHTDSIDWAGTHNHFSTDFLRPNYSTSEPTVHFGSDKTVSSLTNTDVFFLNQKLRSLKSKKHKEIHWELPEIAKSKDALLSELDYFASPVISEEENNPISGRRLYSDFIPKSSTDNLLMPPDVVNSNHMSLAGGHLKNPIYKEIHENLTSDTGLRSSRDWKALEYYKTHGDSLEQDGTTDLSDTIDEEWPKLHRYPGILDLNTILETKEKTGNGKSNNNSEDKEQFFDERKELKLEDHIIPPPPSFCDSDKPGLILPNLYPRSKPLRLSPNSFKTSTNPNSETFSRQDSKKISSHENNHDASIKTDSDCNLFESLPEVQAKNKFFERRTLTSKSRQNSSQLIFNKDSIMKEEEEIALKYFEDICRELSNESQNTSENGGDDKQPVETNITNYRPFPQEINGDFEASSNTAVTQNSKEMYVVSTKKQHSPMDGGLPPNFRMSYEHLLSPDYPYQRRKVISSAIDVNSKKAENLWSSKSGAGKLVTTNNILNYESTIDGQTGDRWIITHM